MQVTNKVFIYIFFTRRNIDTNAFAIFTSSENRVFYGSKISFFFQFQYHQMLKFFPYFYV